MNAFRILLSGTNSRERNANCPATALWIAAGHVSVSTCSALNRGGIRHEERNFMRSCFKIAHSGVDRCHLRCLAYGRSG